MLSCAWTKLSQKLRLVPMIFANEYMPIALYSPVYCSNGHFCDDVGLTPVPCANALQNLPAPLLRLPSSGSPVPRHV